MNKDQNTIAELNKKIIKLENDILRIGRGRLMAEVKETLKMLVTNVIKNKFSSPELKDETLTRNIEGLIFKIQQDGR